MAAPVISSDATGKACGHPPRFAPRTGAFAGAPCAAALILAALRCGASSFSNAAKAMHELVARGDQSPLAEIARAPISASAIWNAMRSRVADTDSVNKSVREELLALGERSRHLEDAVANLAEQRLTGRDALALNEAEFLLQLARRAARAVPRRAGGARGLPLADSALAAAEDPVFAGVRQTISAERQALEAARPLDTNATLGALDRVRANLATLPPKKSADRPPSRRRRVLKRCCSSSCTSATTTRRTGATSS